MISRIQGGIQATLVEQSLSRTIIDHRYTDELMSIVVRYNFVALERKHQIHIGQIR